VDCTDHREDQIELQFRKIIDALDEIELNPTVDRYGTTSRFSMSASV
jgi:hypothetical protein